MSVFFLIWAVAAMLLERVLPDGYARLGWHWRSHVGRTWCALLWPVTAPFLITVLIRRVRALQRRSRTAAQDRQHRAMAEGQQR